MKDTETALRWIVGVLEKHAIAFRISGGFAAHIYGSSRPLADIDIEVADEHVLSIKQEVEEFIVYGPQRYVDEEFDLLLMTLSYAGQEIDMCGIDSKKIFDKQRSEWVDEQIDIATSTRKQIYGITVLVIPLPELIRYKKMIAREVDLDDVRALTE